MKIKSWILLLCFFSQSLLASVPELSGLLKQTFTTHYESGRCGQNILRLLSSADKNGINLGNANIVEITNGGYSVFGLVNVEQARESGRRNPDVNSPFRNLPGERNWYHHVVLEMDGFIFDFDFTNSPTVLSKTQYFELMFLKELTQAQGGNFYVGRDEKMKDYKIEFYDAIDGLRASENRTVGPKKTKMNLREYLEH